MAVADFPSTEGSGCFQVPTGKELVSTIWTPFPKRKSLTRSLGSGNISTVVIPTTDRDSMSRPKISKAVHTQGGSWPPLTPAVFYILVALAEGERHGYAIMQEATKRSDGSVRLGPGTLYAAISRMLKDGLIKECEERPDPMLDDSRRRYYTLTDRGTRALAAEANRLANLARIAQSTRAVRELKPLKGYR